MNQKRKSATQKRLDGTDRADRDGGKIPETVVEFEYKIPTWLDPKAKKWAKENLPKFIAEGLVKETDLTAFYMGAASIGEYVEFSELIKKESAKPEADLALVSKLSIQRSKAQKSFLEFAKELGLTSKSRAVLRISETPGEGDPFAEF